MLRKMSQTPLAGSVAARCLLFDRQGMMWVGTEQGLLRYDGYQTLNYRSDAYSPSILPDNYVRTLTDDGAGSLWIGTHNGVARFDRQSGVFRSYRLKGEQHRIINTLFTARDGTVWAGTNGGMFRYDRQADRFVGRLLPHAVMSFAEDSQGHFFVGLWEGGLLRYDRRTGRFTTYPPLSSRNTVFSMLVDSRDRLWIGTWESGIVRLDRPADEHAPAMVRFNEGRQDFRTYYRLVEDSASHAVWGCCLEGITRVGSDDGSLRNYGNDLRFCNDIQTDNHGNLWVLTQHDGVAHMSTLPPSFRHYVLTPGGQQLPVDCINSLFTADGRTFWLGLKPYGLARYDRLSGHTTYGSQIEGFGGMQSGEDVALQTIQSMVQVGRELWMGSNRGLLVWQPGSPVRLYQPDHARHLSSDRVNALYRQRNGVVWIGQASQVSVATAADRGQRLLMRSAGDDFSTCDVQSFVQDVHGRMWIATANNGIICVSGDARRPQSLTYRHYCPRQGNYPVVDATACYEDSHQRLWAISASSGLFRYDAVADRFEPVNHLYHIEGRSVYSIEEDSLGSLWLTTDQSLVRLSFDNSGTAVVTSYGAEDGLSDLRFSPNTSFHYGRELFFGSQKGFFAFTPERLSASSGATSARLVITDLLVDDRPYEHLDSALQRKLLTATPTEARRLVVPASVNKFTIVFALLTYQRQEQIRYEYQLEGYDDQWHFAGMQQHSVTFQNMPAGTYRLHLKATDSYGHSTLLPYTLTIRVLPPWYLTWWAWLLYALLAVLAVYALFRWYQHYVQTQNRLAMGVLFTNLTHELLTPLTVISVSADEMHQQAPQLSAHHHLIHDNIQRVTRLLRQMLEVRKSQAGQLRLLVSRSDLSTFVDHVCQSIRPMATARGGSLHVSLPPEPVEGWFDPDKLEKILYNLLSNAVKYNREGGRIDVTLTATDGNAILAVADQGIGISPDKMRHLYSRFLDGDYRRMNTLGTGIGLSLTHDLVSLHHGTIHCQSREQQGTTFTVSLPLGRDSYADSEIDRTADTPGAIADAALANEAAPVSILSDDTDAHTADNDEAKDYSMLIVEDNSELLTLMRNHFADRYTVYTARNGQQALNIIHHRDLDIVITDVMMPLVDGIQLTRTIKESPDYCQLPVVMLTAKTSEEDQAAGFKTGADAYITKPFQLATLQLRIDNIIQNRERIRSKFTRQPDFRVEEQHYSSPDELFLQRCIDTVNRHLTDGDFDREQFAAEMCISSSTLYNKLRALTGQNVTGFINSIRLKEACRMLRQQPDIRINELSEAVGFNTPKYFTKCFKREFGMLPKEFLAREE